MNRNHLLALALFATALSGCGGSGGSTPTPAGHSQFSVAMNWPAPSRLVPNSAKSILVTLKNDTSDLRLTRVLGRTETAVEFKDVPAGPGYQLMAEAKPNPDGTGVTQAAATSAVFEIFADKANRAPQLTMESTITRIVLGSSATGNRYLYQLSGTTMAQVTKDPDYSASEYVLAYKDTVTLETRNEKNELVLVGKSSGENGPIATAGDATLTASGPKGSTSSMATFDLAASSEGRGTLAVTYKDAPDANHSSGYRRTFNLPVKVQLGRVTQLPTADGLVVEDVAPDALIAGKKGIQIQTINQAGGSYVLGSATANRVPGPSEPRLARIDSRFALLKGSPGAQTDVVFDGKSLTAPPSKALDIAALGGFLYWIDGNALYRYDVTPGNGQGPVQIPFAGGFPAGATDLTLAQEGATVVAYLHKGKNAFRYKIGNQVVRYGNGTQNSKMNDVAAVEGRLVYVTDSDVRVYTPSDGTTRILTGLQPGTTPRVAAWFQGNLFIVAVSLGRSVQIYQEAK